MSSPPYRLLRSLLFRLDPEAAHARSIEALEHGLHPRNKNTQWPELGQDLFGLSFPNPLAIAAGYDKDARVPDAILALGCGFAEVGTVTPAPQPGNEKPRVFRLPEDGALINRLGFNNEGHGEALARLESRRRQTGIVGVNIGANKTSQDRDGDYVSGLRKFADVASYFMVNVSSPNTPGLRDLQAPDAIDQLLGRLMAERRALFETEGKPRRPIIVKLAPDIADEDLPVILERMMQHQIDGICVSNTTLTRQGLSNKSASSQAGGLSGAPLFHLSTRMLARVWRFTGGQVPLIGVGGINSPERALAKIHAGASLLQLYTGLIYEGPGLIPAINDHLAAAVRRSDGKNLGDLVGTAADDWAARRP